MKTIHKFKIENEMSFPENAKIVMAAVDNKTGLDTVWLEINQDGSTERRKYEVFGTGHDIPELSKHVISYQSGIFIWHIYEVFI